MPISYRSATPFILDSVRFFFRSARVQGAVAAHVAEGLKNNEGCLWVIPAVVTRKAAYEALAVSGTEQSKDFIDDEMKVKGRGADTGAMALRASGHSYVITVRSADDQFRSSVWQSGRAFVRVQDYSARRAPRCCTT